MPVASTATSSLNTASIGSCSWSFGQRRSTANMPPTVKSSIRSVLRSRWSASSPSTEINVSLPKSCRDSTSSGELCGPASSAGRCRSRARSGLPPRGAGGGTGDHPLEKIETHYPCHNRNNQRRYDIYHALPPFLCPSRGGNYNSISYLSICFDILNHNY